MRFSDTLERSAPRDSRATQRVLIVDDDPGVLATLTSVMHGAGYEVTPTNNLREALQTLGSERFQLVLTDLYLGDQDLGYRVAEVAHSQNPPVPVVLLTAKPSFDNAAAALRSRVSEMVVKPVDPHTLLSTCRRTIHEAQLAHRNRQLEAQNRVLAAVLPRAIEIKDPTTSGHADRVVGYAESLARRCGIGQEDREHLRLAALLHDVGKIGVPDTILTKPGALTPDEREVINRHPKMGFDILEPLQHHEKVRLWVYQHHERWDGKGYPEGLAGEDVALPGRILILAEVYDALAETRSYKPAWEIPKIVALFRDQAGRHFDPELAKMVADGLERMGGRFFAADPGSLF